eukprot:scaffold32899_cov68-Phaeocystis_antarctica.AAC.5
MNSSPVSSQTVGDIHGKFSPLRSSITASRPSLVISSPVSPSRMISDGRLLAVARDEDDLETLARSYEALVCLSKLWRESSARRAPVRREVEGHRLLSFGCFGRGGFAALGLHVSPRVTSAMFLRQLSAPRLEVSGALLSLNNFTTISAPLRPPDHLINGRQCQRCSEPARGE